MTLLSFQTTVTGEVAIVTLGGELDVSGATLLENELDRITADHDPRTMVLDLSGLDFMDSTGLRLVVLADSQAKEQDRAFALVRGKEDVHRVFEITRMTDRLRFLDSVAEASELRG